METFEASKAFRTIGATAIFLMVTFWRHNPDSTPRKYWVSAV